MEMNLLIQYAVVGLIFLIALFLTIRSLIRNKGRSGCSSCPHEAGCNVKKKATGCDDKSQER